MKSVLDTLSTPASRNLILTSSANLPIYKSRFFFASVWALSEAVVESEAIAVPKPDIETESAAYPAELYQAGYRPELKVSVETVELVEEHEIRTVDIKAVKSRVRSDI